MLSAKIKFILPVFALVLPLRAETNENLYLNYLRAVKTHSSTFQYYLVVRVKNSITGLTREYCTMGNFLLGALHREYNLGYDSKSEAKAYKMAIGSRYRYFEFKQDSALSNISSWDYTMSDLVVFEKKHNLDSLAIAIRHKGKWHISRSDSIMTLYAHALFNRGILTGENSCFSDGIHYVR
ncbi:MAG: hypothetical protein ACRYFX_17125 [Janthinobacterium lividum]